VSASRSSEAAASSCGPAKTEGSEAPLPLPDLCVAALKFRRQEQDTDREHAGDGWVETGPVSTTRHGTPNELRTFTRSSTGVSAGQRSAGSPCTAPEVVPFAASGSPCPPARSYAHPAAQQVLVEVRLP
jgi:hypothetical protein